MSYDSVRGVYASSWRLNGDGSVTVRFRVPFGCTAEAALPGTAETVELSAGTFEKTYVPEHDFRLKYSMDSNLIEIAEDPEAVEILREDLPAAYGMIQAGDTEFMTLPLRELQFLFFRGFNPEMVARGTRRLLELKA